MRRRYLLTTAAVVLAAGCTGDGHPGRGHSGGDSGDGAKSDTDSGAGGGPEAGDGSGTDEDGPGRDESSEDPDGAAGSDTDAGNETPVDGGGSDDEGRSGKSDDEGRAERVEHHIDDARTALDLAVDAYARQAGHGDATILDVGPTHEIDPGAVSDHISDVRVDLDRAEAGATPDQKDAIVRLRALLEFVNEATLADAAASAVRARVQLVVADLHVEDETRIPSLDDVRRDLLALNDAGRFLRIDLDRERAASADVLDRETIDAKVEAIQRSRNAAERVYGAIGELFDAHDDWLEAVDEYVAGEYDDAADAFETAARGYGYASAILEPASVGGFEEPVTDLLCIVDALLDAARHFAGAIAGNEGEGKYERGTSAIEACPRLEEFESCRTMLESEQPRLEG